MPAPERQKLLLLGDSLTQLCFEGWGRDLANMYQRRADVLNRGMSGYNSRWFLKYAGDSGIWSEPGKVVLVTIFFGANDAAAKEREPAVHVPLPEYKSNLETLVEKSKEAYPHAKVLIIAPPPVHREQRLEFQKKRYGDKATGILERSSELAGKYAAVCREVAETKGIPCVDVFTAMRTAKENVNEDDFGRFLCDGLHFSPTGHKFVFEELAKAIRTNFPGLEVRPCSKTKWFNNSSSLCNDLENSGPYIDAITSKRKWQDAFD